MDFDLGQAVSQVGFPIAVSIYSLVVLNRSVNRLAEIMTKVAAKLDVNASVYDDKKVA